MRRRADREGVQDQRLRVAFPAVAEEAALGGPPHRDRLALVHRPLPVDGVVEGVGAVADLRLVRVVGVVEEGGGAEEARDQERRVDGRELGLPRPAAGLQVQEVVVEAPVPGRVGGLALGAVAEESEDAEGALGRLGAREQAACHGDGVRPERHAHGRDAARGAGHRAVRHEAGARVRRVEEVPERVA